MKQMERAEGPDSITLEEGEGQQGKGGSSPVRQRPRPSPSRTKTKAAANGHDLPAIADGDGDDAKPTWMRKSVLVHPLMVLVQIIFSGYHVLGFKAVNIDPEHGEEVALVFALYRELTASILMALLAVQASWLQGHSLMVARCDLGRFVMLGLFSFGNVVGVVEALTKVSATNVAVMQPAIPVFTMMLSVLFRMERLTPLKALGLAMAVAGAVTIEVVKPGGNIGHRSANDLVVGNIIIVLQCLSMGSLLVAQKAVLAIYHPTVVTAWYYTVGSLFTVVVCVAKRIPLRLYTFGGGHDPAPWVALTYAAVLGTFFNYNAYAFAGTIISPALISIYSTLQPIGTAILSIMFLHDVPTVPEIMCGILVICGLLLTMFAKHLEDKETSRKRRASSVERRTPLVLADANMMDEDL